MGTTAGGTTNPESTNIFATVVTFPGLLEKIKAAIELENTINVTDRTVMMVVLIKARTTIPSFDEIGRAHV